MNQPVSYGKWLGPRPPKKKIKKPGPTCADYCGEMIRVEEVRVFFPTIAFFETCVF